MQLRPNIVVAMAMISMALGGIARADPVSVTGGAVTLGANGNLSYDMVTDGVSLLSNPPLPSWSAVGFSIGCAATGCAAGQTIPFNNETAGFDFFGNPSGFADLGFATVDTDCCGTHPDAAVRAHWTFVSEGASVPTGNAQFVTVTAPFAFRGSYDLSWCDASGCGGGLFMRRTGGGIAAIQLELTSAGYVVRPGTGLSYSFSANATPEPASLLLISTGLIGLFHRKRISL